MDIFNDLFSDIFYQFINPKKRIFIFYLLAAGMIAFLWLYYNKQMGVKKSLKKILNPKIFFSKSSIGDYKIFLLNQIIMVLISPMLVAQLTIATLLNFMFTDVCTSGIYFGHFIKFIILQQPLLL